MKLGMDIEQGDNGWILRFTGHNHLFKVVVCSNWEKVLEELDEYFGWWVDDKWEKKSGK